MANVDYLGFSGFTDLLCLGRVGVGVLDAILRGGRVAHVDTRGLANIPGLHL
jgi:hypothetical protein